jgi:hypothetical protein
MQSQVGWPTIHSAFKADRSNLFACNMPFNVSRGAATGFNPFASDHHADANGVTFFNGTEKLFRLPAGPVTAHSIFSDFPKSLAFFKMCVCR